MQALQAHSRTLVCRERGVEGETFYDSVTGKALFVAPMGRTLWKSMLTLPVPAVEEVDAYYSS